MTFVSPKASYLGRYYLRSPRNQSRGFHRLDFRTWRRSTSSDRRPNPAEMRSLHRGVFPDGSKGHLAPEQYGRTDCCRPSRRRGGTPPGIGGAVLRAGDRTEFQGMASARLYAARALTPTADNGGTEPIWSRSG